MSDLVGNPEDRFSRGSIGNVFEIADQQNRLLVSTKWVTMLCFHLELRRKIEQYKKLDKKKTQKTAHVDQFQTPEIE